MPRYEFRCRRCPTTFEVDRPMRAAGDPATCPAGHDDTVKLLGPIHLGGVSPGGRSGAGGAPVPAAPSGGGCCGGGCCG